MLFRNRQGAEAPEKNGGAGHSDGASHHAEIEVVGEIVAVISDHRRSDLAADEGETARLADQGEQAGLVLEQEQRLALKIVAVGKELREDLAFGQRRRQLGADLLRRQLIDSGDVVIEQPRRGHRPVERLFDPERRRQ